MEGCWKVKAHALGKVHKSLEDKHKAQANDWADTFAKLGARLHPSAVGDEARELLEDFSDVEKVGKLLVALWGLWPQLPKGLVRGPRKKPKGPARAQHPTHQWKFGLGRWQCEKCLAVAASTRATSLRSRQKCKGKDPSLLNCPDRGHSMQQCTTDGVKLHWEATLAGKTSPSAKWWATKAARRWRWLSAKDLCRPLGQRPKQGWHFWCRGSEPRRPPGQVQRQSRDDLDWALLTVFKATRTERLTDWGCCTEAWS